MTTPVPKPPVGDESWDDWATYIADVAFRFESLAQIASTGQFADLSGVPDFPVTRVWDGTGTPPDRPSTTRQVQWFVPAANQPPATGNTNGGSYATAPGDVVWAYGAPA